MWTNRQLPAPSSAPNRTSPSLSPSFFLSFFLSLHFIYFHLLSVSINIVPFFQPTTPFYVLPFSFSLIFSHTHIPIFVLSSNFFLLRDFHSISGFFTPQFHP